MIIFHTGAGFWQQGSGWVLDPALATEVSTEEAHRLVLPPASNGRVCLARREHYTHLHRSEIEERIAEWAEDQLSENERANWLQRMPLPDTGLQAALSKLDPVVLAAVYGKTQPNMAYPDPSGEGFFHYHV